MCSFSSPDIPAPQEIPERQSARLPDGETAKSTAGRRMGDRARSGAKTILTSGSGVLTPAATQTKTLLGA